MGRKRLMWRLLPIVALTGVLLLHAESAPATPSGATGLAGLTDAGYRTVHAQPPGATLDPGWIAFAAVSGSSGDYELYKMRPDGSEVMRLTNDSSDNRLPSWSPDGQWIAFAYGSGSRDIYKVKTDGSGEASRLTDSEADDTAPCWSPDGEWIAFKSNRDGNSEIYKIRADGLEVDLTRLTEHTADDQYPAWSPDGKWIAFRSDRDGNLEIYKLLAGDVEDRQVTRLTDDSSKQTMPSWSPDGQWIAFQSGPGTEWAICKMRSDGSAQVTCLTDTSILRTGPSWSPDGEWICFDRLTSYNPAEWDIYKVRADGASPESRVANYQQFDVDPDWWGEQPTVKVQDEGENALAGARVYRNGELAGTTGPAGTLRIPGLREGDQLAATYLVDEVPSLKASHSQGGTQDWAYRVYLTSVAIDNDGNPQLHRFDPLNPMPVLTVTTRSALIGSNIVAAVEWDASPAYLDELRRGFERASAYLYDATDGQALFERVTIYDDGQQWGPADYQVTANNRVVPFANEITVIPQPQYLANSMHFGRYWERRVGVSNPWTDSDAYRTLVHEFGHYALGLYDSYLLGVGIRGASCTSTAITSNATPDINATVMYWQYNATEFSMRGVAGLWSPNCEQTLQFDKNNGESDWETIARHYSDSATPPRWELVTPAARGEVAEGPSSIPVASWSTAAIGNDADTGTCSVDPDFLAQYPGGAPAKQVEVWLASSDDTEILQGKTGDDGAITVLGARNGDKVTVESSRGDWRTEWTVACATELGDVGSSTAVTTVILEPAPFRLDVAVTPAGGPNQATIRVEASTLLNGSPQVGVFQSGAAAPIAVAMVYDPGTDAYTGALTLDPALPLSGSVEANAIDTHGHSLETFTTFNLSEVTASQDATIYGPDGLVELYLPQGTLSADGCLSIVSDSSAGETPEELVTLSGPYSIQGDEGTALTGNAPLTMGYGDTNASVATAQIYRWDGSAGTWVALNSTVGRDGNWVSASIDALGTYALMAHRQHVVNLPLTLKNYAATPPPPPGWYVAANGDDGNSCRSPATPCRTIQAAIDKASSGDTVYVADGTYDGSITLKERLMLLGAGPRRCTIRGHDLGGDQTGVISGAQGATVAGFTIGNDGQGTSWGVFEMGSISMTFRNNVFVGHHVGVHAGQYSGLNILNNVFEDNHSGITFGWESTPLIRSNILVNNYYGISWYDDGSGSLSPQADIDYNDVWRSSDNYHDEGGLLQPGAHDISADPLFVNSAAGDYHLRPCSPAINAGDPASDYSNEPAPNGGRINMGAYGNTAEAESRGPCP